MDADRRTGHRHNVPAARVLRGGETRAEAVLWEALRGRRLDGLKLRRQHPIGPFVIDFCCVERRLAIEIDGGIHDEQSEQDATRDALLLAAGFRTFRNPNEAVLQRLPDVLERITAVARSDSPPPGASSGRRVDWR